MRGAGMRKSVLSLIVFLLWPLWVQAESGDGPPEIEIEVVGLFADAAVLNIDGRRALLKAGEESDEGVKLISATSREAVVEYHQRSMTLDLSDRVGGIFEAPKRTTVSIPRNDQGQYLTQGSVNDRPVQMLVDTGASIVAMNMATARELGVDLSGASLMRTTTAGGVGRCWKVVLGRVQLGDIRVHNVPAAVLEGRYPEYILLGMTFLTNVEITEKAGLLMLTSKL